jgi:hypothetical protein
MWNAPSDRDYYGIGDEPDGSDRCLNCGARWDQACEENCSLVTGEDLEEFAASSWAGIESSELVKVAS